MLGRRCVVMNGVISLLDEVYRVYTPIINQTEGVGSASDVQASDAAAVAVEAGVLVVQCVREGAESFAKLQGWYEMC